MATPQIFFGERVIDWAALIPQLHGKLAVFNALRSADSFPTKSGFCFPTVQKIEYPSAIKRPMSRFSSARSAV